MRRSLLLIGLLLISGAVPARAQGAYRRSNAPDRPERIVLSDGRTWERVRLQYMDVRVLTALAGAPNLATEYDVMRMRYGGGAQMGGYGGYGGSMMGGYGGPMMGGAGGYGMPSGMSGGLFGGRTLLGDSNSNSILVGPGRGGGVPAGNNRLFPGLILFGDPNTNSLIVDP